MKEKSLQLGWNWAAVDDLTYWEIPDGHVMNMPYYIGKPPAKILDLGCGIGRHIIYFASLGYDVTGFDISAEAVKETKHRLAERKLKAEVKQGKMTHLSFQDQYFDFVLAFNVIYHAYKKDVRKTISEIERVLKPGGYFFVTILTKDPNQPFHNLEGVIDEQTIVKLEEPEKGVPHFFSYIDDVLDFFKDFKILDLYYKEWYQKPYTTANIKDRKGNGHYILLLQKK